ncbi:hypothetical protein AVEN_33962-1 [Araneus ventricosus]|uniref:Uncharacterized protein n=1 Tax=Araneus ventricosus TaxID=182803 RepID=A0A4Y2MIF8_ARAVE|nr:hypothetical protein AVEN_33962-1 [Araneus ventricosus]
MTRNVYAGLLHVKSKSWTKLCDVEVSRGKCHRGCLVISSWLKITRLAYEANCVESSVGQNHLEALGWKSDLTCEDVQGVSDTPHHRNNELGCRTPLARLRVTPRSARLRVTPRSAHFRVTLPSALLHVTLPSALLRVTIRSALLRVTLPSARLRVTPRSARLRVTLRSASLRSAFLRVALRSVRPRGLTTVQAIPTPYGKGILRLHKLLAEVETDEDPEFDNEDNGPEDVLEVNF